MRQNFYLPSEQILYRKIEVVFAPSLPSSLKQATLELLPDPAFPEVPDSAQVLKTARQRLVLRLFTPKLAEGSCIVKMFPLRNPISRLKHRKYARREFLNALAAEGLGMQVPAIYAFFQRRHFGLIAGSGLAIQDLRWHNDIAAIASNSGDYVLAARCAIPALVRLYELGINHVDARDENILIAPDSEDGAKFKVIDWQYASFCTPRSDWLLEHLAAYFIRMAPANSRSALLSNWLPSLHSTSAHPTPLLMFTERVAGLLKRRVSIRARLNLQSIQQER
jgi:hypothetical protein